MGGRSSNSKPGYREHHRLSRERDFVFARPLSGFDAAELHCVASRFIRLHPRLTGNVIVFSGRKPVSGAASRPARQTSEAA